MSQPTLYIGAEKQLELHSLWPVVNDEVKLALSDEARERIKKCRTYLDNKIQSSDDLFYGINTGFGSLCDVAISKDQIEQLQENLVLSHACGMGDEVPAPIVRLMMVLKLHALSLGHSGISIDTCEQLIGLYNAGMLPVVYQQGSLGASGDLSPLAHMALPLIGHGEVRYEGTIISGSEALQIAGLSPIKLKAKEGLALLNGTQFMSSYGTYIVLMAEKLADHADMIAAASIDAFNASIDPFYEGIHAVRPFAGQTTVAVNVRKWLADSQIQDQHKPYVQDPYSFRCVPQVHGASRDALQFVERVINTEVNSVTDNPLIFPDEDKIVSGGNFHGQPLALALDQMAIALAEWASISERRIYQLVNGLRELPRFLVQSSGLNSGLMIPQYTAASLVSQSKQLCTPASVDTITSSAGQEDHVSMGANAATKCYRVLKNSQGVLGIELLTAMQALDLRAPLKSSPKIEALKGKFRNRVEFNASDRAMYVDMQAAVRFLQQV